MRKKLIASLIILLISLLSLVLSFYLNQLTKKITSKSKAATANDYAHSFIVWWPAASNNNDLTTIATEMDKMVKFYHPEYLYLLISWISIEPKAGQYDFALTDAIIEQAKKRNMKVIFHLSTESYGGIGSAPFSYANDIGDTAWFWKHTREDGTVNGLYDPLTDAMRYPPTCGCNCNNAAYGKDVSVIDNNTTTDHVTQTCDGIEKVPTGAQDTNGKWITKTIRVNENPDLVTSNMDTSWPGTLGNELVIHSPHPSFSSPNYRQEIQDVWHALVTHNQDKGYENNIIAYDVWHEPSYAHFREYYYNVDYSQVELNRYNSWLQSTSKATVSAIPNPPNADYIAFKKWNLASMLSLAATEIRSIDSNVKVSFNMFMYGQNDSNTVNNITSFDPKLMLDLIKPDIIQSGISGTWDKSDYGGGVTVKSLYDQIKSYNTANLPLLTTSINLHEEVFTYNSRYFPALKIHYIDTGNVSNMPLTACWASASTISSWQSENELIGNFADAYSRPDSWDLLNHNISTSMIVGGTYSPEINVVNNGQKTWDTDNFRLTAVWLDSGSHEVDPKNLRAHLPSGEIVYPGEQQKFIFDNLPLPSTPSAYLLKLDMVEEGVMMFNQPQTLAVNITLADGTMPTATPSAAINLNLKLKFQGISKQPTASNKIIAAIKLEGGENIASMEAKSGFYSDAQGIFSGKVSFDKVTLGNNYQIKVKGEKHLSKTFKDISIVSDDNNFDFTDETLLTGDLPPQDGVIDSIDTATVLNLLGKTDPTSLAKADLNLDGIVDSQDYSLILSALEVGQVDE